MCRPAPCRFPRRSAEYEREIAIGSLYVGSPETVARKIAATVRALGANRFDMKYSAGILPHEAMLRTMELYGREVIPRVRDLLAEAPPVPTERSVAGSSQ
jgi:alkanesulfonate monooxygenase SsuD/methylene tetrahydromethanopterin reductase-like flavin-dependent oxidoreductase (luciferase family)